MKMWYTKDDDGTKCLWVKKPTKIGANWNSKDGMGTDGLINIGYNDSEELFGSFLKDHPPLNDGQIVRLKVVVKCSEVER